MGCPGTICHRRCGEAGCAAAGEGREESAGDSGLQTRPQKQDAESRGGPWAAGPPRRAPATRGDAGLLPTSHRELTNTF